MTALIFAFHFIHCRMHLVFRSFLSVRQFHALVGVAVIHVIQQLLHFLQHLVPRLAWRTDDQANGCQAAVPKSSIQTATAKFAMPMAHADKCSVRPRELLAYVAYRSGNRLLLLEARYIDKSLWSAPLASLIRQDNRKCNGGSVRDDTIAIKRWEVVV